MGPPDKKVRLDGPKPMTTSSSARREGDEVAVAWEIQEEYPDLASLQLEYRPADAPSALWAPVTVSQALVSQARVRPTAPGPLALRLQMKDQAGTQASAEAEGP